MTRRLVLWRHGQTEWNVGGRGQGHLDVPLDDVGRDQAKAAAARLASLRPTAIVSSDLSRAYETAAALAELTGLEVQHDPALREINLGQWQGLTRAEVDQRFADERRRMYAGEDIRRGVDGETMAEVADRAGAAIERAAKLAEADGGSTVIVVAHGLSLRVGACHFLDVAAEHWNVFGGLSNCAWIVLEEGRRGWRFTEWNAGTLPEPVLSGDDVDSATDEAEPLAN
ncbi:MAG TPA: histidine phosphatase family protein [Nocardioidaceae bacterium]|nr:histidine phosphatase family protein [Nocardioidaceae bacterium]